MVMESNADSNVCDSVQKKPNMMKKATAASVKNGHKKDFSSSDESASDDSDSSDKEVSYFMHTDVWLHCGLMNRTNLCAILDWIT